MVQSQIQLNPMGNPGNQLTQPIRVFTEEDPLPRETESESESPPKSLQWWAQLSLYSFLVLGGQAAAVLLGRLYFAKGGNSKWLSTLVQCVGFPALLPLYCVLPKPHPQDLQLPKRPHMGLKLAAIYTVLGLLIAFDCMLYSIGLVYLPVSTYSLICASQLAFNAFFAFLINSHRFTPYIVNSIVILTVSSTLLVFQHEAAPAPGPGHKYLLGFICTVAASALFGLILPLTQLAFDRVIKKSSLKPVIDMLVYEGLVATAAAVVGLFGSGEWRTLKGEMEGYQLGRLSYAMTLLWIALAWQVFSIGALKLVTQVSSVFSNVISTLGLPIVPVLAVLVFKDEMDGIKAVAMVLAIWGFVSYGYQCYIDHSGSADSKPKLVQVSTV